MLRIINGVKPGGVLERKLWHQLTQKLEQFVALTVFQAGDALVQLYHNFICDSETKINLLKLVHFAVVVSKQYPEKDAAIACLEDVIDKLKTSGERRVEEPILYVKMQVASMKFQRGEQQECKKLLEEGETTLDSMTDADPSVHASAHWVSSQYFKSRQEKTSDKNDLPQMEGLQEKKVKMVVHLHPSRASNVQQGVREILNSLLLRYNEHFEGSVLAHSNTKIQGRTATILEGLTPYFCVRLTTTLLLFSPKVGFFVEGKVNKVEEDYLGVVVLGLFNAAIGFSDIRNELVFCEGVDGTKAWISESDDHHCIKIGSLIRFSVKSVQENEEIVDLTGALIGPQTGCVKYLALSSKGRDENENHHRTGLEGNKEFCDLYGQKLEKRPLSENGAKMSKLRESKSVEERVDVSEGIDEHTPKKKKKRKDKNEAGGDSSVKKRRKSLDVSTL